MTNRFKAVQTLYTTSLLNPLAYIYTSIFVVGMSNFTYFPNNYKEVCKLNIAYDITLTLCISFIRS